MNTERHRNRHRETQNWTQRYRHRHRETQTWTERYTGRRQTRIQRDTERDTDTQ